MLTSPDPTIVSVNSLLITIVLGDGGGGGDDGDDGDIDGLYVLVIVGSRSVN